MGSYTGIVLVNPEQKSAAYPVFNLDRAMERLQFINSEEEVAELLAGSNQLASGLGSYRLHHRAILILKD